MIYKLYHVLSTERQPGPSFPLPPPSLSLAQYHKNLASQNEIWQRQHSFLDNTLIHNSPLTHYTHTHSQVHHKTPFIQARPPPLPHPRNKLFRLLRLPPPLLTLTHALATPSGDGSLPLPGPLRCLRPCDLPRRQAPRNQHHPPLCFLPAHHQRGGSFWHHLVGDFLCRCLAI